MKPSNLLFADTHAVLEGRRFQMIILRDKRLSRQLNLTFLVARFKSATNLSSFYIHKYILRCVIGIAFVNIYRNNNPFKNLWQKSLYMYHNYKIRLRKIDINPITYVPEIL